MRLSMFNSSRGVLGLAHQTIDTDTTTAGATVDLNGSGTDERFRSALLVFHAGTLADGAYAVSLEESVNNSDWTAVAAPDVVGSASVTDSDSDSVFELGYQGSQRYVRCSVESSDTTDGGDFVATWVLGQPVKTPIVRA
jgi:hypothetical protein